MIKLCAFQKLKVEVSHFNKAGGKQRWQNVQDRMRYIKGTKIILIAGIKRAFELVGWFGEVTFILFHATE